MMDSFIIYTMYEIDFDQVGLCWLQQHYVNVVLGAIMFH